MGYFLTSWEPVTFSRRVPLHEVSNFSLEILPFWDNVEEPCRSQTDHRWHYGTWKLHAGHLRLQIYAIQIINNYCSSTATIGKWNCLNVVLVFTFFVFFFYIFPFCSSLESEGHWQFKFKNSLQQLDRPAGVCVYCCALPQYSTPYCCGLPQYTATTKTKLQIIVRKRSLNWSLKNAWFLSGKYYYSKLSKSHLWGTVF